MNNTEIRERELVEQSAMDKLYLAVDNGNQLSDDIISDVILFMRLQLQRWKDSQSVTLHIRDKMLLCLSALLSAVKRELCRNAVLLDILKDSDFRLVVSYHCQ